MKDQLIKWGFEEMHNDRTSFVLMRSATAVCVGLDGDKITNVAISIAHGPLNRLPNCNNELALINLLYILGLLEV